MIVVIGNPKKLVKFSQRQDPLGLNGQKFWF